MSKTFILAATIAFAQVTAVVAGGDLGRSAGRGEPGARQVDEAWVGGADGGVWIVLRETGQDTFFGCVIYPDRKTVWYRGAFRLGGNHDVAPRIDAHAINAWDGLRLHFAAGGYLEATNPIKLSYGEVDSPRDCLPSDGADTEQ